MIKAIIFDCDGTLVDSEYSHFQAWKHALNHQGADLTLDEYYHYVGKSTEAIAELLSKKLNQLEFESLVKDKSDHFLSLILKGLSPIHGTLEFLHRVALEKEAHGLKLGVASASRKQEILHHLNHLEILSHLDVVLSGSDDLGDYNDPEGVNKPKPYIYLLAAKRLNVRPEECAVIEDSQSGVKASMAAGCFTIAVPNSFSVRQDFSQANLKLDSLEGLGLVEFLKLISTEK